MITWCLKHAFRRWSNNILFQAWLRVYIFIRTGSLWMALGYGRHGFEVVEVEDFLTPSECEHLVQLASEKDFHESTVSTEHGVYVLDRTMRRSRQCWLKMRDREGSGESTDPLVSKISEKIQRYIPLPRTHQEDLQIVHYSENEFYRRHFDTPYQDEVIKLFNRHCGPRVATFLIYLNDDFDGGETDFILANRTITPQKGKAIFFYNIDINLSLVPESLHVGRRVKRGTKWIATTWIRVWPFMPTARILLADL